MTLQDLTRLIVALREAGLEDAVPVVLRAAVTGPPPRNPSRLKEGPA